MGRGTLLGVVLGVLGLLGWLASHGLEQPPVTEPRALTQTSSGEEGGLWRALSQRLAETSQEPSRSIRGTVMGPRGPVAGVEVRATRAVPGESLSSLPCEGPTGRDTRFSLLTCQEPERLSELVAQRQGEVPVLARTTSAGDGSFALEGLEAGTYALWAQGDEGTGVWQDIEAGQQGLELRLGVGVRLFGTIRGEGGGPVPGALVTAIFTHHSRFFEAVADATGYFSLGPLPRGDYEVLISGKGWLTAQWSMTAYGARMESKAVLDRPRRVSGRVTREGVPVAGARVSTETYRMARREVLTDAQGHFSLDDLSPWDRYPLTATHEGLGARVEVEFHAPDESRDKRLLEHPEVALELVPVAEVRGRVLDEARRPLAGVVVSLNEQIEDSPSFVASTRTDEQGRYVLGPANPGPLALEVKAEGWLFADQGVWNDFPAGTSTRDLVLSRAAVVEGIVLDSQGQPVADANVDLRSPEAEETISVMTGSDGRFLLNAPKPGTYPLTVRGSHIRDRTQDVSAPSSLRLVAESLPAVEGEVVDEAGTPVSNVEVSLWPEATQRGEEYNAFGMTDARGHFSLPTDSPGHYLLSAEFRQGDVVHSASRVVELARQGTHVQLRFEQGHALSGVVVDTRGQPRAGAFVFIKSARHAKLLRCGSGPGEGGGMRTGADGRFTFQDVAGDSLELVVQDEGYILRERLGESRGALPLEPGARDVRVVLVRKASVRGRLVRADGSKVIVYSVNGQRSASMAGVFYWPISTSGVLQLEFSSSDLPTPVRRTVSVQEEVDQDLGTIVLGGP